MKINLNILNNNKIKIILIITLGIALYITQNIFVSNYFKFNFVANLLTNIIKIESNFNKPNTFTLPLQKADNLNQADDLYTTFGSSDVSPQLSDKISNYIANLYLLNGNNVLGNKLLTGDDWSFYFNKANVFLFSGYNYINENDNGLLLKSFDNFQFSLENYNISKHLSGTGNSNYSKITTNEEITIGLRELVSIKICDNIFNNIFQKFLDSLDKMQTLVQLIDKQVELIQNLIKTETDKKLKECYIKVRGNLLSSKANVLNFQDQLKSMKNQVDRLKLEKKQDPLSCVLNRDIIQTTITNLLDNILSTLDTYNQQSNLLKGVLESEDKQQLKNMCEQSSSGSEGQDQDTQLGEQLNKLNENLNQNKPNNQNNQQQPETPNSENGNEQMSGSEQMDLHYDIDENDLQRLFESVEHQSDSWIKEMENLKSQKQYDPEPYLRRLFKEFYGNIKDFKFNDGVLYDEQW